MAFHRFVVRCGKPTKVWSDNGTNMTARWLCCVVLEGGRILNLCHELNHFHTVEYRADHK